MAHVSRRVHDSMVLPRPLALPGESDCCVLGHHRSCSKPRLRPPLPCPLSGRPQTHQACTAWELLLGSLDLSRAGSFHHTWLNPNSTATEHTWINLKPPCFLPLLNPCCSHCQCGQLLPSKQSPLCSYLLLIESLHPPGQAWRQKDFVHTKSQQLE